MSFPITAQSTEPSPKPVKVINKQGLGKATNQALQVLLAAHKGDWLEQELITGNSELYIKYRKLAKIFYQQDSVIEAEIMEVL